MDARHVVAGSAPATSTDAADSGYNKGRGKLYVLEVNKVFARGDFKIISFVRAFNNNSSLFRC